MTVLITGGCGFLGARLATAILQGALSPKFGSGNLLLLDVAIPAPSDRLPGVAYVSGDITDDAVLARCITEDVNCIYHLAAVLSGGAEVDYELSLRVNVDGTRAIIRRCREVGHCPRLILTSSVAVFGPSQDCSGAVSESCAPRPESSYGTQKAVCELLVADASRRKFVDGICCRLPTISVRPGRPNSAASSFCSNIIREPMQGQPATCPVDPTLQLWIQSPRLAVQNLLHAARLEAGDLSRIITVPGITTTPAEMIAAMERAGGRTELVSWERDDGISSIVGRWPGFISTPNALALGFRADESVQAIIDAFVEDDLRGACVETEN